MAMTKEEHREFSRERARKKRAAELGISLEEYEDRLKRKAEYSQKAKDLALKEGITVSYAYYKLSHPEVQSRQKEQTQKRRRIISDRQAMILFYRANKKTRPYSAKPIKNTRPKAYLRKETAV